jgi:hypothetical protein
VGHQHHDTAANRDPTGPAWPRIGDQHNGLRARPLGSALCALLGGLYGIEACLLAAVAGFLLQAVIIARSPVVSLEHQPKL